MDIDYANRKLEKQCTIEREMSRAFDRAICKTLRRRMVELLSANDVADLRAGPGNWHWLTSDRDGQVAGRLSGNWRIVIEPDPKADDATAAVVVSIEDYHRGR